MLFDFSREDNTQAILNSIPKTNIANRVKANKFLEIFDRIRSINSKLLDIGNDYQLVTTTSQLLEYKEAIATNKKCALDTETTGLSAVNDRVVGISLYTEGMPACYIPVNHVSYITGERVNGQLEEKNIKEFFSSLPTDTKWVFHNSQFDTRMMRRTFGINLKAWFDTYTAQRLLNENEESNGLKDLYVKYVLKGDGDPVSFSDLFEKVTADKVPMENMYIYASHDAFMTYKLMLFQIQFLDYGIYCERQGLERVADVFWTIEMPIVNIMSKVEDVGFNLDYKLNDEIKEIYQKNVNSYEKVLYSTLNSYEKMIKEFQKAGRLDTPINFNSHDQLAVIMYDIMGLEHNLRKKKKRSTDKFVLRDINNDFTKALLSYKQYNTLINNFLVKMPNMVSNDGRVHTRLNPQGADTMRFSSSEPNLQQIPSHDIFIRKTFLPKKDYVFVSGDYSKQEVVVVAYLAQDEKMLEAFKEGKDIYSAIAALAYELPYEECTEDTRDGKERRSRAKAIVLGENKTPL